MEEILDQLRSDMFKMFARFEYALKAAGFHNGSGPAKPDWAKFAKSVSKIFDQPHDPDFDAAVEYILTTPPKQQFIKDGLLEWTDMAPSTTLKSDLVLQYVRRVRNNLFHGGKFNGRWFEPERSEALLHHSLTILRTCLRASPEVSESTRKHRQMRPLWRRLSSVRCRSLGQFFSFWNLINHLPG
jgi:hypothetical protein